MDMFLFYTDPGSGIMLLQLLLASAAGAFYYFRNFFFRLFGRNKKGVSSPDEAGAEGIEAEDSPNS